MKHEETIDRYLKGQLDEHQKKEFENLLRTDADLRRELDLYRLADAAVWAHSREKRRSEYLDRAKMMRRSEARASVRGIPVWQKAAALAAVLLGLLFLALPFFRREPNSETALFEKYFQKPPAENLLGADPSETAKNWERALKAYPDDCATALPIFEKLAADPVFDRKSKLHLLAGACLLEQNRPDEAIANFKKIPPEAERIFREAQWYTALALLKKGQKAEAKSLFLKISVDPANTFAQEAKAIANEI